MPSSICWTPPHTVAIVAIERPAMMPDTRESFLIALIKKYSPPSIRNPAIDSFSKKPADVRNITEPETAKNKAANRPVFLL